ncbi:MAG TPA: hypothetical protein VGB71_13800, partial [Flavisolibacter sp.]
MKKSLALLTLLLICISALCQIPEVENNNTFALANPIARYEQKIGSVNTTTDEFDFFRTVIPEDGTLEIYVQATNVGAGSGWLYLNTFDRRQTGSVSGNYITGFSTIPANTTVFDTIIVNGMAADTVYFRFHTSRVFNYKFSYSVTNITPNDVESNNDFASALPLALNETKQGHVEYFANGDTYDPNDYYRAILPSDGTMKIYVGGTNRGSGTGWLHLAVYDRRKTGSIASEYIDNTTIVAGASISDTITIYGLAADTVYFRLYTNGQPFDYSLRYDLTDLTPNDTEPNSTFADALPVAIGETKRGHVEYFANGDTYDPTDYYRAVLPADGTLKIYVEATNQSGGTGWLHLTGYDRRRTTSIFGDYVDNTAVPRGGTIRDTFTVYGRAADTTYIRLYTNGQAFSYKIRYEIVDTSTNDVEPNNTFATALPLNGNEVKQG